MCLVPFAYIVLRDDSIFYNKLKIIFSLCIFVVVIISIKLSE